MTRQDTDHGPGRCAECGTPLSGKQLRWCTRACHDRQHNRLKARRRRATEPEYAARARRWAIEHPERVREYRSPEWRARREAMKEKQP